VANIQTEATTADGGETYSISGEKKWITCGTWADYFVVTARTGKKGMSGLTLFLIERGAKGLRTRPVHCQGNIGSGTAFVILDQVVVHKSAIIGGLNKGFKVSIYSTLISSVS
jgi:alkylation response protein AidB-like acyl-CoA dehydrogenase